MFFIASKLFWFIAAPSNALALLIGLGIVLTFTRFASAGRRIALLALALLLFCGLGPVSAWLLYPLEARFPDAPRPDAPAPAGIIVLGGAVDDRIASAGRPQIELNEAGDRVLAMIALAQRYPETRIIFTGGAADVITTTDQPEGEAIRARIAAYGLDPARIIFETQSRNTHENALLTLPLARPKPGEEWWLVTSAWHMPRAIGVFRAAGYRVRAYPVDYRTASVADLWRFGSLMGEGLRRTDLAAKEWIGLLAYRVTGRTDAWLPGPE
jgi:uncharacterized SAM-binding protein YcdF (DUF218 family)